MLGYQGLYPVACEDYSLNPTPLHRDDPSEADESAWQALLDLAGDARTDRPASGETTVEDSNALMALYLPLCQPIANGSRVLGHLGQSIDGYIATASGDSDYVNDPANIRHLHRLRALNDAVIVGAGTIAADNPELTTRHVPGPNPVRVVLDPQRRLPTASRVFTDGAAATILVVADTTGGSSRHGRAEVLFAPANNGEFDLVRVVEKLRDLGLRKLFVEGGGTTVSRFLNAEQIDRLHIAIAPVLTGRGKPGLRLPSHRRMADCPRPIHRVFTMGQDILFDCDLRAGDSIENSARASGASNGIRRIR